MARSRPPARYTSKAPRPFSRDEKARRPGKFDGDKGVGKGRSRYETKEGLKTKSHDKPRFDEKDALGAGGPGARFAFKADKRYVDKKAPRFDVKKKGAPFGAKPDNRDRPRGVERSASHEATGRERSDTVLIWGLHAARAAWLNPKRRIFRLWLSEAGQNTFEKTIVEARDELLLKRPDAKRVDRSELDRLTPPASVHQGIIVEASLLHEPPLHEIIGGDNPPDLLLMLDQVTDPHNVGAILRSAAAFGAGAVILTERNAPGTTGVMAKAASGALEHVPQIHVVNLARALDELRDAGYWSVGLAEEGERDLSALDLTGRTVLVLGAEGEGLRQLTRKKCDELARLPTGGPVSSLNVSNAAVVGLYEIRRQKKTAT